VTLALILYLARVPPPDALAWFLVLVVCGIGGLYVATWYQALRRVLVDPSLLLRLALVLALPSMLVVASCLNDARTASTYLASADSSRGRVTWVSTRGDTYVAVDFPAGRLGTPATGQAPDLTPRVAVGDSLWVYYPRGMPDSAVVKRPTADVGHMYVLLGWVWLLGGPILLAFGGRLRWSDHFPRKANALPNQRL
jgi:hypothetical protein